MRQMGEGWGCKCHDPVIGTRCWTWEKSPQYDGHPRYHTHTALSDEGMVENLHCWEDGPDHDSTCLLLDNHDGPHVFTADSEIQVRFSLSDEEGDDG